MQVYRNDIEIIDVVIDNQTQLKKSILNEDFIQASFVMESYFDFQIGDYVNWRGKKYTILEYPSVKKVQANQFQYNIDFKSDQYRFQNAMYLFDGQTEFYLVGNFQKFANLITVNMNRIVGSDYYQLGEVPQTDVKNLNFSNFNCLYVTQFICKEFDKEFYFSEDGKTLNFVDKIGKDTELFFEFRSGLRNIERQKVTDTNLVTRLYAFGGERNITREYGGVAYSGKRLKLPSNYLEKNTDKFGVIEAVVNFDEVYPQRTGVVSAVDANDIFKFTDTSMDFNLNDQLIGGVTAKLSFNTGRLAGYELEITTYNHSSKTFEVIQYEDENGFKFPSEGFKIQVGDEYILHDIKMPQSYVDNAEAKLEEKARQYLDENSLPNVIYSIVPDYPYLRKKLIQLDVGDIISIRDKEFGIEFQTRIISLTQSLANEYLYSIKVGNKVTVSYLNRIVADTLHNANNIRIERYDRTVKYNQIRKSLKNIDELRDAVFDPDGYFDADKIKPLSIETQMLSVGGKSQNYLIRNLLIEANYQSNPNKTNIGNGTLVHFTIADTVKEWNLTGATKTHTDANQYYYIYARCVRNGNTGDFLVSSQQYKVDAGDTYYYFWIGVLHSAVDNVRGISLTYGQTTINGKFITTGKVQSIDGINFFDLDTGQFNIGNETSGLDWNVSEENKLTLRGALVQMSEGTALPIENSFEVEYSSNATSWHATFVSGDVYMRQRRWSGTWSNAIRIVGEAGQDGTDGTNGQNGADGNYTDYVFRRSASQPTTPTGNSPTDWANTPPAGTAHLWMSKAEKQANGTLIGSWSAPVRLTGEDGQNGKDGFAIVFRGEFNASKVYYNNTLRRDVVKYNGTYYLYKGTNGVALAWSTSNWETFGAQFESIATNLLLAENANIADWIIKDGKITSQNEYNSKPRAQFDGANGKITLISPKSTYTNAGGERTYEHKLIIDSLNGRIEARHDGDSFQNSGVAYVDSEGVFANFAGIQALSYASGIEIKGAIVGSGNGKLNRTAYSTDSAIAGVVGIASNSASDPAPAYGGLFFGLKTYGMFMNIQVVTGTSHTITGSEDFISCYNSDTTNVYLPTSGRYPGRVIYVKRLNGGVNVYGNGKNIWSNASVTYVSLSAGDIWFFVFDGNYWLVSW